MWNRNGETAALSRAGTAQRFFGGHPPSAAGGAKTLDGAKGLRYIMASKGAAIKIFLAAAGPPLERSGSGTAIFLAARQRHQ